MGNLEQFSSEQTDLLVENILKSYSEDDIKAALSETNYGDYSTDPIGFCEGPMRQTLTDDIRKMMLAIRDNPITVAVSANAVGKSQPIYTKTPTPEGFRELGSIEIGDYVFSRNGKPTMVTGVYPQGLQRTYRITFNDRTSVLASEDHLWTTRFSGKRGRGKYTVRSTKDLVGMTHRFVHIPMCEPVEYEEKGFSIDPYIMGGLADCGLKTKSVPSPYLFGSVDQRKELLAGLMDSDGEISNGLTLHSTASKELSEQVRELVWSLGGIAWIRDRISKGYYTTTINVPFCPFHLDRKVARWKDPETMQKQAQRVVKKVEFVGYIESVCIRVDNEESLYLTENYTVTHNTFAAALMSSWFYKCRPGAQVITATAPPAERNLKAKLWGEIRTQVKLNPEMFSSDTITSLHIQSENNPKSFIDGVTIPMAGSEEQREAKFSGMHAPNLFFVLDEGDAIPDEIYRAIESCMSGGFARLLVMFNPKRRLGAVYRMIRDGRCAVVSMNAFDHPNVVSGKDLIPGAVTREQTGKRINEWTSAVVDGEVDSGCFEVPKFMVGYVAKNDRMEDYPPIPPGFRRTEEPQFSYMVLGEYPLQSSHQLISVEWIDNARSRWDLYVAEFGRNPPQGVKPSMGMDAADLGEDYNTLCTKYGSWIDIIKRWHGMDIPASAKKASIFYHERDGAVINVDATGVGAGIAPAMNLTYRLKCSNCGRVIVEPGSRSDSCPECESAAASMEVIYCNAKRIMVASKPTEKTEMGEFGILRDQLWWAVREWLRTDPGAMLPPGENLVEELSVPEYVIKGGKIKVMSKDDMRKQLGRSPDDADALCLCFIKGDQRPRARLL